MQYSTNNQLPMLPATKIDTSVWFMSGRQARIEGKGRHQAPCHTDLRASDAWLDGWDHEHMRIIRTDASERSKAIEQLLARRKTKLVAAHRFSLK